MMLAYVSRVVYPDPAANALQTMQMAAALAHQLADVHLFAHDLTRPEQEIRQQYGIDGAPLTIRSLHTGRWPRRLYNHGIGRFATYNSAVAAALALQRPSHYHQPNILFVRSRLETLYWGLIRPYLWWLRHWLFVCELHDLPLHDHTTAARTRRTVRALGNYDLVFTVTEGLAADIRRLTDGRVQPHTLPLCTGLPRLPHPPVTAFPPDQIVLGYVGTIDRAHGVDDLLKALPQLPPRCVLRLVGRVREEMAEMVTAAVANGRIQLVAPVPYTAVADQIDQCHIVLAPAGPTHHSQKYRSPLKIFDYLARGKPIIAADVPCHQELLDPDVHTLFYRPGNIEELVQKIQSLLEHPHKAQQIAYEAWQLSRHFTYQARAQRMIGLFTDAWKLKRAL